MKPAIRRVHCFDPASMERYLVACYDAAEGGPAFYAYSTNYLIDLEAGIIEDVEATPAHRSLEVEGIAATCRPSHRTSRNWLRDTRRQGTWAGAGTCRHMRRGTRRCRFTSPRHDSGDTSAFTGHLRQQGPSPACPAVGSPIRASRDRPRSGPWLIAGWQTPQPTLCQSHTSAYRSAWQG